MAANDQGNMLHPNGRRVIAIRDVQKVYGNIYEIPLGAYQRSGALARPKPSSHVTPEQVRRASDQWDGEGILEDIDTQWGLVPQGGMLDVCGYGSD